MRYYLYISDAKVDMLLPQVPRKIKKKVTAELGFDLKVLTGSIATERLTLEDRVVRLQAVEKYLRSKEKIGTPDLPATWIEGRVAARTVDLGQDTVFFIARNPSSVLGLGGSSHHLVGAEAEKVRVGTSFLPNLLGALKSVVEGPLLELPEDKLREWIGKDSLRDPWGGTLRAASNLATGPEQHIKFLARKLLADTFRGQRVTLATPLYVELDEEAEVS